MGTSLRGSAAAQLWALLSFFICKCLFAGLEGLYLLFPKIFRPGTDFEGVVFYTGKVRHKRAKPVEHSFTYNVRYILVDLASKSPYARKQLQDRLTVEDCRSMTGCSGKVQALMVPKSASYEQNPLVVYYCHNLDNSLLCCIAEVTNTPW